MIVQFSCSVMSDSLQPHATMQQARPLCPSPTPKVYPNSYPLNWWCHPTISSSVVPFSSCCNLSQHQDLFKWVSSSHQEAKILEFQLQHHPSNEHPGLIPFSMDWLDLLAVQGTPKSLLQHHSSKAPILHSAFFISNSHIHTWLLERTKALTRWTFVDKVMSLLFSMLARLVITFIPRSKSFLISWLQSPPED